MMVKIDFNFSNRLLSFKQDLASLSVKLNSDLEILKAKAGKPLDVIPVSPNLIEWADNLFESCYAIGDYGDIESECPKILKYLTLSPLLKEYLAGPESRRILIDLVSRYPRERYFNNLLLHYFRSFLSFDKDSFRLINELFVLFARTNIARLTITQFYIANNLNVNSSSNVTIIQLLENVSIENLLKNAVPLELRNTEFYHEVLVAISSRLYLEENSLRNLFWEQLIPIKSTALNTICIAKYILSAGDQDKEFCKQLVMQFIADPSKKQLWILPLIYTHYQKEVEDARKKVEIWINEQFISAFFNTMEASDRGEFWLDFVDEIKDVKILGSPTFLERMKRLFPTASRYLDSGTRFRVCGKSSAACVFMEFSNHIIVLFDTEGKAGICLQKLDSSLPEFKYYSNVTSLINGSLQKAYDVVDDSVVRVRPYGRLFHQGTWRKHFRTYLREVLL